MACIYQTTNMGEAQVRAALVTDRQRADLLVHRVSSLGLAHGDALWYITPNKQDATSKVLFCAEGMAQVRVCFVDTGGEAHWQRPHPLKGCF